MTVYLKPNIGTDVITQLICEQGQSVVNLLSSPTLSHCLEQITKLSKITKHLLNDKIENQKRHSLNICNLNSNSTISFLKRKYFSYCENNETKKYDSMIDSNSHVIQQYRATIYQTLNSETINRSIHEINLAELPKQLSIDDIPKIFALERQVFYLIETASLAPDSPWVIVYQNKIKPLSNLAKKTLSERPFHPCASAAASKGRALQAATNGLYTLITSGCPFISANTGSTEDVILLENEGFVIKNSRKQSREEEELCAKLFQFKSEKGLTDTVNLSRLSLGQFGIKPSTCKTNLKTPHYSRKIDLLQKLKNQTPSVQLQNLVDQYSKQKWYIKTNPHSHKIVSFTKLQFLYLSDQLKPSNQIKIGEQFYSVKELEAYNISLIDALQYCPQAIQETVLPYLTSTCKLINLHDFVVKPFIHNMVLMNAIQKDEHLLNNLLNKITEDSLYDALMTGELQFLDLHAANVGLIPKTDENSDSFSKILFIANGKTHRFVDLILEYCRGIINDETQVQFQIADGIVNKPLKEIKNLKRSLECPFEFAFFDANLCFAESNTLQIQVRDGIKEHLIPLRSTFLGTKWKNKPLSKAMVEKLIYNSKQDATIEKWILKADAPIRKQLSQAACEQIDLLLTPIIQKYSLKYFREIRALTTFEAIQESFCDFISTFPVRPAEDQATSQTIYDIWTIIRDDLNCDLTIEKHKKIANQLFPRATLNQLKALNERQLNRSNYLLNYIAFSEIDAYIATNLYDLLKQYINEPTTPLCSYQRNLYAQQIEASSTKNTELQEIYSSIIKVCQPSFFNLMCAMYPLLADAYTLYDELDLARIKEEKNAGYMIGHYKYPLEEAIALAHQNCPKESSTYQIASYLAGQIESSFDLHFFGKW